MIVIEAYGKINWCLSVRERREDGYHEVDMLLQSVSCCDTLTLEEDEAVSLRVEGWPHAPQDNLVLRAAALLQPYASGRGARMALTKRIPVAAGMGGGSADAAAALRGLSALWELNLPEETLAAAAMRLGADVPFMLRGGYARAQGIGEELTFLPVPQAHLVLVKGENGLSTAAVYGAYDAAPEAPCDMTRVMSAIRRADWASWDTVAVNALQHAAERMRPEIAMALHALRQLGAYARMSGSGPTVFGVFKEEMAAERAAEALRGRFAFVEAVHAVPFGLRQR